jgi:hypothetical protein
VIARGVVESPCLEHLLIAIVPRLRVALVVALGISLIVAFLVSVIVVSLHVRISGSVSD